MKTKIGKIILFLSLLSAFLLSGFFIKAQTLSSESDSSKIAPGEVLPVSVKLVNFGSQQRVDVIITYIIFDKNGNHIYSDSETVAVDTTASFIKKIQLPENIKPGAYTVETSMQYPYQVAPAVSKFQIIVEEKIAGFFISDLILYGIILAIIIIIAIVLTYFLSRKKPEFNIDYHDYSDKPKEKMIYYEILSDIIAEMRLRVGDDALKIAEDIPGLSINAKTGLVLDIKEESAKIIALLIARYEKILGQKVSFSLRKKI